MMPELEEMIRAKVVLNEGKDVEGEVKECLHLVSRAREGRKCCCCC
jgi:hypothetical protein